MPLPEMLQRSERMSRYVPTIKVSAYSVNTTSRITYMKPVVHLPVDIVEFIQVMVTDRRGQKSIRHGSVCGILGKEGLSTSTTAVRQFLRDGQVVADASPRTPSCVLHCTPLRESSQLFRKPRRPDHIVGS